MESTENAQSGQVYLRFLYETHDFQLNYIVLYKKILIEKINVTVGAKDAVKISQSNTRSAKYLNIYMKQERVNKCVHYLKDSKHCTQTNSGRSQGLTMEAYASHY